MGSMSFVIGARWSIVVGWSQDGNVVARDKRRERKGGSGWI